MIISIKSIIIGFVFIFSPLLSNNNDNVKNKTNDPLSKAIESKSCPNLLTGWYVSSSGEWQGNKYVITITCDEGGTDQCPQQLPPGGE